VDTSVWRVRGEPLAPPAGSGPLDGLRVAVKDLFAVAGQRIGAGNPTWLAAAAPEPADADAVARLRAAGASVVGIAQTDELAFSLSGTNVHYGAPPNPAAPGLVTAGSSSGPAAAVALGEAHFGLGTDTGGSIRVPASCCGVFGLRPTHGAVPTAGVVDLAPSYDTVGWLTRDAATLRAVGAVLLPPAESRPFPRRLVLPSVHFAAVAPDVAADVEAAARRLAAVLDASVRVVPVAWESRLPELLYAFRCVQAAEAWRVHGSWIEAHPGALGSDIEGRFRFGARVGTDDERRARDELADWRRDVHALLGDDAWLALPAGGPGHARDIDDASRDTWRQATLRCSVPASACGLPSVSLPARPAHAGPPVGLALVGPAGADHALLDAVGR
jgi:Asp-tRNA(Asn)/Glu-tRNA(Gln) amidotransferase A subunit family amidase